MRVNAVGPRSDVGIQLPRRVAENIHRFTGRSWLLAPLLEWWDRGDTRLFLLTGPPGTGKSMIAAWLAGFGPLPLDAELAARLERVRRTVTAAHFCQATSRNFTPQAFAEAMASQLARTVPRFGEALAAVLQDRVQVVGNAHVGSAAAGSSVTGVWIERIDLSTLTDDYSFDQAFTRPLKKAYESGYTEPMLVIVDALDESLDYSGKTLAELLSGLDDLPHQVRILATTRQDPRVLKCFDEMATMDLIAGSPLGDDDVRSYAAETLRTADSLDERRRAAIADALTSQAKGVFLYAAMVVEELLAAPPTLPNLDSQPLPEGLSGLYRRFLKRELAKGRDESLWFDTYQPLLGLLAVSQGDGFTAPQLAALMDRSDVRAPLRACKQYLTGELPHGPFKPFHKSFADFLLEEEDNPDFHIDAGAMHRRIADHYRGEIEGIVDAKRVDSYALAHYASHLVSADRRDELVALVTGSPRWMQAKFEALLSDEPFVSDVELASRNTTAVGQLVNLYAALTVVRLKAAHYDDDDLKALSLLGRAQEARGYARLRPEPADRISGLIALVAATDRAELRSALLDEALDLAHAGGLEDWKRSTTLDSLDSLAVALVQEGRINEANELASSPFSIAEALVTTFLGNRQVDEALKAARGATSRDGFSRAKLLGLIGNDLSRRGDDRASSIFEEALSGARAPMAEETQATALGKVAAALAPVDGERAARVFDEALQLATAIPKEKKSIWRFIPGGPDGTRTRALQDLSVSAARAGLSAGARAAAEAIEPPIHRFRALCNVAVELANVEGDASFALFSQLTGLALQYGDAWQDLRKNLPQQSLAHAAGNPFETLLAEGLARAGRLTDAEAAARSVSPLVRLQALRRRMVGLARARDPRAAAMLADIVRIAQSMPSDKSLPGRLGTGLANAGYFPEALRAIAKQTDDDAGNARRNVAIAMADAGRLAEAMALADTPDPVLPTVSKELIMCHVAKGFSQTGQFDRAVAAVSASGMFGDVALADHIEALAMAGHVDTALIAVTEFVQGFSNPSSSSMVLRRLATALADRLDERSTSVRNGVMEQLKHCLDSIPRENEKERVEAAAELAVAADRLRLPGADKIFAETIDAAQSIKSETDRDRALLALAMTWADGGYFDRAREAALALQPRQRDEALHALCEILSGRERFAEALEVARAINQREDRLEALADVLARQGCIREALETLSARGPHHFPTTLAGWAPWLERYGGTPATSIVRDALAILAWANPAYSDIAAAVFYPS